MNKNNFNDTRIPVVAKPVQSNFLSVQKEPQINIKNPMPVGWLVISKDKETGGGVKMALYNKLPNKFQQFCIKLFFGWWIETEEEQVKN